MDSPMVIPVLFVAVVVVMLVVALGALRHELGDLITNARRDLPGRYPGYPSAPPPRPPMAEAPRQTPRPETAGPGTGRGQVRDEEWLERSTAPEVAPATRQPLPRERSLRQPATTSARPAPVGRSRASLLATPGGARQVFQALELLRPPLGLRDPEESEPGA